MIVELIRLANDLDSRGLVKEADVVDAILSQAGLGSWLTGGGWKGDKPGWGDNPSTLESDRKRAEELRARVNETSEKAELGIQEAGWGQGGEGFHDARTEWLEDFEKAQRLNLTVDQFRSKGRPTSVSPPKEDTGLSDSAMQGLPEPMREALKSLTPEQMQILGNLLMKGGPADASPANTNAGFEAQEQTTA